MMPSVPFKPMNLSQLLDATFKFYRDHFKLLFLALLSIQSVSYIVSKLVLGSYNFQFNPDQIRVSGLGLYFAMIGAALLFSLLINTVALGVLTFMISDSLLGKEITFQQSFAQTRSRFWPLIGTSLLAGLIMIGGFFLCVIPALYFFFSYLLAAQVVLMESESGMEALRRSKELMRTKSEKGFTKNNVFKASILLLVIAAITYSVQTVTALPQIAYVLYRTFSAGVGQPPNLDVKSPLYIATEIFSVIGYCLTKPLGMIALVLLYYDIRSRKEGLDLEILAESLTSPEKPIES